MLCFPNCKINLGLYITGGRDDGYHNLETLFYPVVPVGKVNEAPFMLRDVLEIVPAADTRLHMSGLPVAGNETNNLVLKAYQLLQQRYAEAVSPLDIYLHKVIPMGAGLGGGSADGAFMLRLMNDYFRLGLNDATLAALALQLGSDCPFFIYNTPQYATGRGEIFTPATVDLTGYSIQVVCPEVHVSTAAAFAMIRPRPAGFDLSKLGQLPISDWKDCITNDFEEPVFAQHGELAGIKEQLYEQGAVYASMSGSGSAIYGIFPQGTSAVITSTVTFSSFYMA
jgi:4-diphosphocytidyl-2-C-methyl-D-erythritol kinase